MSERIEHDLLGERTVPGHVLYGVHTLRAVENFPITGTPISRCPALIVALARVKHAAALANKELGLLDAGKVNPVIPEVVNQIAFEVIGNDMTITMAAEAGQLQLNAFEPIIAHSLHKSIRHLIGGCRALTTRCVAGISANHERLREIVESAVGIVTALNPYIGYANAVSVAQEALATGQGVRAIVLERALLDETHLLTILQPEKLTRPYLPSAPAGDVVGV